MIVIEKPTEITGTEASGGIKPHIVRYMLIVSTLLTIAALAIVVLWVGTAQA
jgi:hypothetical protein